VVSQGEREEGSDYISAISLSEKKEKRLSVTTKDSICKGRGERRKEGHRRGAKKKGKGGGL